MQNIFSKASREKVAVWVKAHKKLSGVILVVVLLLIGGTAYAFTRTSGETKYVLGSAEKGTVIVSVSGTGQVSASNEIELTTKASGQLISVSGKAGQHVAQGATIAVVDPSDASFELQSARLSYDKLTTIDPSDKRKADQALADAYQSARSSLTSTSIHFTTTIDSLADLFSKDGYLTSQRSDLSDTARPYRDAAEAKYYTAKKARDAFIKKYSTVTSATPDEDIEALLDTDARVTANAIADATKAAKDAVSYERDREEMNKSDANSAFTTVSSLTSTADSDVSMLMSASKSVNDATESLTDVTGGADTLDIRSSQLSLRQKEEAYADHFVTAPFAGILASVDAHVGDTVGSGTKVGTLITEQKLAEISLNEVDAAKVKVGQKATLTFDAIDGLTISGTVAEVEYIGTVEQGVVNYTVKIGFDTDDDRIRPGMTVSADIITDIAQDVLTVPASAVKTNTGESYVEVLTGSTNSGTNTTGSTSEAPPIQVPVTLGLAGDELVEIKSGLEEGQQIVVRTISAATTAAAKKTTTQTPSLFGSGARTGASFGGGR